MDHPAKRRIADAAAFDRVPFVDRGFSERVQQLSARPPGRGLDEPIASGSRLTGKLALELFRSQLESRHLDYRARELKKQGRGFYTIGSAGHEGNAAIAAALAPTDPALLHYRSGAFFLQRAKQAGYASAALDVLLGIVASADEPIAGGRHKVFGSAALRIPPQTSTIASHLPKAVGMAFALERARRLGLATTVPDDAVVVCSFGDASVNHSTATGAINAACWAAHQGTPVPLLLVCEDNGLGISVPTPQGWIAASCSVRAELGYREADGRDLAGLYEAACEAVTWVRSERRPVFLHVRMVRLLGHAGSDIEALYRGLDEIEQDEARDPLVSSAELLAREGLASPDAIIKLYEDVRRDIAALAELACARPKIETAREVVAPLAPRAPRAIAGEVTRPWDEAARRAFWGDKLPEHERPAPLGQTIGRALGDMLVRYPEMLLFGEDVAQKGGVYAVTRELYHHARRGRVFDTLLDEQTILGIAIGAGQLGLLPVPEIQYLAYLHNAEDQLRGEAASLSFFSQGQLRNPMVLRIAAYGYQKGFGGHFHNDNSVAVLRDIPGIVVASPATGVDAVAMLQTCMAAAKTCGSVCVLLEPIALYPVRDLHQPGDGLWCTAYQPSPTHVAIGEPRIYQPDARDLLIVSWANGLWMSLRCAKRLQEQHGLRARVIDCRWLVPLPTAVISWHAEDVGRVLIVDETRRSGGVSEGLMAELIDAGFRGPLARVTSLDSYVPLGDAANLVLVQEGDIERAALELAKR